ncbi:MAG: AsmA family protein [Rhodoplanes sp.]|uniref:AsmA family protein n=1 Tax=Rhodoplanes sp. TaxID=1968906 RepID=UPI0018149A2E|nr:AsmA family protein [Rhodoplanes sp.]NVO17728.1 AsmA family protein [Rhodoplanes sp.]
MISKKIAAIAAGVVLIAIVLVAVHGIPARGMIEQFSRDPLAKNDLALDIIGDARLTIWPSTGLTLDDVRLRDATTSDEMVRIERVQAGIALGDLWSGRVRISDLTLTRPVVRTDPMFARAARAAAKRKASRSIGANGSSESILPDDSAVSIGSVTVDNATMVVRDGSETADVRIDSLRLASLPAAGGRTNLHLDARMGPTTIRVTSAADTVSRLADGRAIPIEATVDAPRMFRSPATLSATVTSAGPVLKIDGLNGTVDQGRLRGTVTVSFAGAKPFVDATLESERLDLTTLLDSVSAPAGPSPAGPRGAPAAVAAPPWSDVPLNLFGLRLVEANIALTAREVLIEKVRIAPAAIETTLLNDALTVKLGQSGLYGGQATAELALDRSRDEPIVTVKTSFSGLSALPFLRDAVDFEYIEGRARGSLDVTGTGASPRRIVAGLAGRADLLFEDGAVRGIDMPGMLRSLLDMILAGWQSKSSDQTRFSTFKGSFAIQNGVARTMDVAFTGPYMVMSAAGNIDIRAKTLDLRADPRLITSPDTPGKRSEAWGIGVPVAIQGSWSDPKIYADTPNILANPDGALKTLRDALGPGGGAQIGKMIEGLKGLGQPTGPATGPSPAPGLDVPREPGTLADDIMKALKGVAPAPTPAPQYRDIPAPSTAPPRPAVTPPPATATAPPPPPPPAITTAPPPRPAVPPPPAVATVPPPDSTVPPRPATPPPTTRETRPKPAPEPTVRELEQGAREFLKDLLGR